MRLIAIDGDRGTVELSGVRRVVHAGFVPGLARGDYVLVHAGFVIERCDPVQAEADLELFGVLGLAMAERPDEEQR
jgi:hydrogenase expression/formation protein HypC